MDAAVKLHDDATAYLAASHRAGGLGMWRRVYADLLASPPLSGFSTIAELGAGTPDFLAALPFERRLAVDIGDRYRAAFEAAGIDFRQADLERDGFESFGRFEIVICSDVFEHLLFPHLVLGKIKGMVEPHGLLFSHVPNEYVLKRTLRIMLGRETGLYFHRSETEWTDPHIRRFTDLGYRDLLGRHFRHNVKLTRLKYKGMARLLGRLGLPVPFCLEGGPTYASTDDPATADRIRTAVRARRR